MYTHREVYVYKYYSRAYKTPHVRFILRIVLKYTYTTCSPFVILETGYETYDM